VPSSMWASWAAVIFMPKRSKQMSYKNGNQLGY